MTMTIQTTDQDNFRSALGSFASGVTVVTFWSEYERPCGMTASSFSSVSIEPFLVLFCVNRSARTYNDVVNRGRFGINILSSHGSDISDHCARPGEDKELNHNWLVGVEPDQPPIIKEALAYLDCELYSETRAGTHSIIVGSVSTVGLSPERTNDPLLYYQGTYREMVTAESVTA